MPSDPLVIVLPSKFVKGVDSLVNENSKAEPGTLMPLREAMATAFQTDAHFLCYVTLADGAPVETQYRLTKAVLGQLLARGATAAMSCLGVDVDNPGHGPWSKELVAQFDEAIAKLPAALKPAWIYRTRGGFRLVYELTDYLLVQDAEPRHRGLIVALAANFSASPFVVDTKCSDWTRCLRAPQVVRDEKPSSADWSFSLDYDPTVPRLDWRTLVPIGTSDVVRTGAIDAPDPSREPPPTPEECRLLLHNADNTETDFGRLLRINLAGMKCAETVSTGIPPQQGARDQTMMTYIGEITRRVFGPPLNGTPGHVYAALLPAAEQMEGDAQHPSWPVWLWGRIGYSWRRLLMEKGSPLPPNSEPHPEIEGGDGEGLSLSALADKVRLWCPAKVLDNPDSEAAQVFVKKLAAVCIANKHYHVLKPSGYFDPNPVTIEHLGNELIRNGWGNSFKLFNEDKDGTPHAIGQGDLLGQLMVRHIEKVEGHVGHEGDTVRGIDSERLIYDRALYRLRTDIEPAFSPEVDELMMAQAGPEQIENYRKWIAYALDFTEPICMLALRGTNGIGKSFMGLGLADCLASPAPVLDGATLMSTFPEDLLHTPFIEISEALPVNSFSVKARDRLRQMIGGAVIGVNRKNRSQIFAHTALRILITTNNDETIRQLADEESSLDDVRAIMQRTLVLQLRDEAGEWLSSRGGRTMTRGWVSNGGSQQTDFKMARHFLWLHSVREQWATGSRMLVEGEGYGRGDSETADTLRSSDSFEAVARAVCQVLAQHDLKNTEGLSLTDKDVALTTNCIERWFDRPGHRVDMSARAIGLQLKNLGKRLEGHCRDQANGKTGVKARWWVIDLPGLLRIAQKHGWPSDFLAARVGQLEQ